MTWRVRSARGVGLAGTSTSRRRRRWATSGTTSPAKIWHTFGRLELPGLIEDYRQGLLPQIVPLTLLAHHLSRYPVPDWAHQQVYLHPYPKELMLRNHV